MLEICASCIGALSRTACTASGVQPLPGSALQLHINVIHRATASTRGPASVAYVFFFQFLFFLCRFVVSLGCRVAFIDMQHAQTHWSIDAPCVQVWLSQAEGEYQRTAWVSSCSPSPWPPGPSATCSFSRRAPRMLSRDPGSDRQSYADHARSSVGLALCSLELVRGHSLGICYPNR